MRDKDTLVLENLYKNILQEQTPQIETPQKQNIETFGQLFDLLKNIQLKAKGGQIAQGAINAAIDTALGFIPGASSAKTAYEFFKACYNKPDDKKTNTVLDRLDVDDQVSLIVDDNIENAFLKYITELIQKYKPEQPIPPDWDMTRELNRYLKTNYQNRSTLIPGKADKAMASSEYRTVQPRKATATKFVANANLPQQ
jgi:hypothetical protein